MGMAMMGTGTARGENRAREAAEAAIRSPLLEDINLEGARGILVNITAGLDLSLGEFSEVGDTIEEFASENATVVVGTVIDPSMKDELKVTVVATGLGAEAARTPLQVVEAPQRVVLDAEEVPRARTGTHGGAAEELDTPMRTAVGQEDYFDIPAFLRRQAD